MTVRNITFNGISGLFGVALLYNIGLITIVDNLITNCSNFGFGLFSLEKVGITVIDSLIINEVIAEGSSDEYFFWVNINEGSNITYNNVTIQKTQINDQPLIYIEECVDSVSITDMTIENVTISPTINMIVTSSLTALNINGMQFANVTSNDEELS